MIRFFSYDIFDTCLVRSCGHPDAVFDALASSILGKKAPLTQRMDFAFERKKGESLAREKYCQTGVEDVTLKQIYDECDFSLWTNIKNDVIRDSELAIERQVLSPVKSIVEEISERRNKGGKIIFISDMYLPSAFLKDILFSFGIMKEEDALYVSNEYLLTKDSGRLFDVVAKDFGIDRKAWLHSGDNIHADVRIPKLRGIRTRLISHKKTYYERSMTQKELGSSEFDADKLASISKTLVLKYGDNARILFASDFVAPVYVPFVYGVLNHASEHQLNHLYFLARDGYIFLKIAEVFLRDFPDLDIHYLYVSRNSLYLPGLKDLSYESVSHAFVGLKGENIDYILDRLHLSYFDYTRLDVEGKNGEQILRLLLNDKHFVEALNQKRNEQRTFCKLYFEQQGLNRPNTAIVDLAGTRRCHVAINNILQGNKVFGYYFCVDSPRERGTNYYAINFKERCNRNPFNSQVKPQYLFEQYFSACSQLRTSEYQKDREGFIFPVFEDEFGDKCYKSSIEQTNILVCQDFARHFLTLLTNADSHRLCGLGISAYTEFFLAPDYKYLRAVSEIVLTESQNKSWHLLEKRPWYQKRPRKIYWNTGDRVYNSVMPQLMSRIYQLRLFFLKYRHSS